jgi:lipopolysaccharide biosynthesis regulator YciM
MALFESPSPSTPPMEEKTPTAADSLMKSAWQKHVLASSGYRKLGMFDDAANVLEEIEPKDEIRKEVLGARIDLYMAAKKWDMAAAVASHLVNVEPEEAGWWISLAYSTRRCESIEEAEKFLLRATVWRIGMVPAALPIQAINF